MPNQSCTIILNGHGLYSSQNTIDSHNYNIIFPCKPKNSISSAHHNLMLKSLYRNINNSLLDIEDLPSTQKVNNTGQIVGSMNACHIRYTYEHALKNAPNMTDVISLYDIDQVRFGEHNRILVDYVVQNRTSWNTNGASGTFKINYDINQIQQDVLNAYQNLAPQANATIQLSQNNLIYLTPVAANGHEFSVKLSNLMTDIIPKIKIPIKYTPAQQPMGQQPIPASVEVSNNVFLDDGTFPNNLQNLFQNAGPNDVYHEMTIAGDANLIWDACRDFAE